LLGYIVTTQEYCHNQTKVLSDVYASDWHFKIVCTYKEFAIILQSFAKCNCASSLIIDITEE